MKRLCISDHHIERLHTYAAELGLLIPRGTRAGDGSIDEMNRVIAEGFAVVVVLGPEDYKALSLLDDLADISRLKILNRLALAIRKAAQLLEQKESEEDDNDQKQ